jgi:Flp pilus assembly protein TadG
VVSGLAVAFQRGGDVALTFLRSGKLKRRRGVSIVYVGIAMFALLGLISLAVDLGRVRMVHAQMQAATDASAFGGTIELPTADFAAIEQAAIDVAAANKADQSSVVVKSADIEFGIYDPLDRTFTVLAKGNGGVSDPRHAANALRVTANRASVPLYFARVVGVNNSAMKTVAAAFIRGGPSQFGIVGLDGINSNGNKATIDSYNAAKGVYSGVTKGENATAASNKVIDLGNGDILGDARPGPGYGPIQHGPNGGATGWTAELETPLVYPPVSVPAGAAQLPNIKTPIPGGTPGNPKIYQTKDFPLVKNGTTSFTGPVRIYVTGAIDLKGNTVVTPSNVPGNLEIFVVGPGPVSMNGTTGFSAHLYAPQAPLDFHGTPDYYGTIVAKSILFKGTADIHYDESLGPSGVPFRSVLVE